MSVIEWSDSIGAATLGNAFIYPGNRFANWSPNNRPFGVRSNTLATGALNVTAFRDDLTVSLDVVAVPNTDMAKMLRLQMHLKRGGTVTLDTSPDTTIPTFGDCKLAPGADVSIQLTDKATLEYTVSTVLRGTMGLRFSVSTDCKAMPLGVYEDSATMTFNGAITKAVLTVSPSGDATVDVLRNGVSICAAALPTVLGGTRSVDTVLLGWDTAFVVGDVFTFNVVASTVTALTLNLSSTKV